MVKLLPLCLILISIGVPSVYATWKYCYSGPGAVEDSFGCTVGVFDYPPEEVVPDDEEASTLGQNHLDLLQMLLNEKDYGLNATKKPIIHKYLENPGDVIYCSQNVQGGNLKHLLIDSVDSANALYFVVTKISDTEYHAFTFKYSDIKTYPVGDEIEVYKTVLTKESGKWDARYSYYGRAKVNSPGIVSRAIDVTTWYYVDI